MRHLPPKNARLLATEKHHPLARIFAHARVLAHINSAIQDLLPEACRQRCQVINATPERVVFATANPAMAQRLRMVKTQLLVALDQGAGLQPDEIVIRVIPPITQTDPAREKSYKHIGTKAKSFLRSCARNETDPDLRRIYARLACLPDD